MIFIPTVKSHFLSDAYDYFCLQKIMENFEPSSDMYVTPQRPPYSENLQTPPWNDQRCFHEKVDVRKKTGARKKTRNYFSESDVWSRRFWTSSIP